MYFFDVLGLGGEAKNRLNSIARFFTTYVLEYTTRKGPSGPCCGPQRSIRELMVCTTGTTQTLVSQLVPVE